MESPLIFRISCTRCRVSIHSATQCISDSRSAMEGYNSFRRWILLFCVIWSGCDVAADIAQDAETNKGPLSRDRVEAFPSFVPALLVTKQELHQEKEEMVQDKQEQRRQPHAPDKTLAVESPSSCDAPTSFVESRVSADDDVSCFPHDDNRGSRTTTIKIIVSSSVQSCLKVCRSDVSCSHFTYNKYSKRCHIKHGVPEYYTYNGDMTGPRSCNSSCFLSCVTYAGSPMKTLSYKRQAPECQSACYASPGCKAFVWEYGTCQLYGAGFSARRTISDRPTLAGPRGPCESSEDLVIVELNDGHSIGGCFLSGDVGSTTPHAAAPQDAPSAAACQQRCASYPTCSHYTYNTESRKCFVKKGSIGYYRRDFDVTGSRDCVPP